MDWEVFRPSRAASICLVLLSFSFLLMSFRLNKKVQAFRAILYYWVSPTQETAMGVIKLAGGVGVRLAELVHAHRDNLTYREQLVQFSLMDAQYRETFAENRRLKGLLDLKSSIRFDSIPALVFGRDTQNWISAIWIDRGSKGNVELDSPVLSVRNDPADLSRGIGGVVGRVLKRGLNSSISLITSTISLIGSDKD